MSLAWLKFLVFVSFAYENYAAILPDGGEMIPTSKFGTKSYYFSYNFKANFYQSNQVCEDLGMRLVTIPTKEVNDFLYQNINAANKDILFWSSGTNLVDGINWVWISSAIPVVYTNWLVGQPDNPAEHCIELISQRGIGLQWNNLDCNVELNFVCESLDVNDNGEVIATNWAGVFADPSVSPNFPVFNYNENSYYIGNQVALSYMESTRFCKLIGMELVSIESEEENYMIYKYIRDTVAGVTFWSGGSRLIDGVNWYWLPSGRKVIYTSWLKGQPDTKVEYCIQLQFLKDLGLFWNDLTCAVAQNFICKVPTKKIARCPTIDLNPNPSPQVPKVQLIRENATYAEAIQKCENLGLKLVSIPNKFVQEAVNKVVQESGYTDWIWTSGTRMADHKNWRWLGGQAITEFFWGKGEPNNIIPEEECLSIKKLNTDSIWNDAPCSYPYYFICESPSSSSSTCHECCHQPSALNVFVNNKSQFVY